MARSANLPPEVKRRALAEYLIDNELFADAAEAAKLAATPEFEQQMHYLQRRVLREQYFEKSLKGTVERGRGQEDLYDERIAADEARGRDRRRATSWSTAEEKAKELHAKIVAGADFAQLAKENSTDTGSKDQGGLLGYFGTRPDGAGVRGGRLQAAEGRGLRAGEDQLRLAHHQARRPAPQGAAVLRRP